MRILIRVAFLLFALPQMMLAGRYEMQSNFWVNLHQRLLYTSQYSDAVDLNVSGEDAKVWKMALEYYRSRFGKHSPVFNRELIGLNGALSRTSGELPAEIAPELRSILQAAAGVYRRNGWEADDQVNRFWMRVANAMLADAEEELIAEHERVYGRPFAQRIRVDVTPYAGQFGAYTTGFPTLAHVTISSRDPGYQGFSALEMLMHEPSHVIVDANDGAIGPEIQAAAKKLQVRARNNLWHAILFFTSGELTRHALAQRGVTDYVTTIDRGMYERGYGGFKEPLETWWRAYLAGKISRAEAIEKIVAATAAK